MPERREAVIGVAVDRLRVPGGLILPNSASNRGARLPAQAARQLRPWLAKAISGQAISSLERDRHEPSALELGSKDRFGVADSGRDHLVSIWLLTLALFICFLACSFVVALLASHFGWLGSATLLL
jgi:hypothetical protein